MSVILFIKMNVQLIVLCSSDKLINTNYTQTQQTTPESVLCPVNSVPTVPAATNLPILVAGFIVLFSEQCHKTPPENTRHSSGSSAQLSVAGVSEAAPGSGAGTDQYHHWRWSLHSGHTLLRVQVPTQHRNRTASTGNYYSYIVSPLHVAAL